MELRIGYLLKPVYVFFKNESITGVLLFLCTAVAMVWANSPFRESYNHLWENLFTIRFADFEVSKTLHHWINDGLMSIFFFVVGLELKREIIGGELSTFKKAVLPVGAAIGGMVVPALIYLAFNHSGPPATGWGIPMATDIAFALGVLLMLGKRIPVSAKLFLMALAIADDLGAVMAIAFFYTSDISFFNLAVGAIFLTTLIIANILGVRNTLFYALFGIGGLWLAFLLSGVHATIAGALGAFAIPARTNINEVDFITSLKNYIARFEKAPSNKTALVTPEQLQIIQAIKITSKRAETPLQRLEYVMHPFVGFIIIPIFALSNAGIELSGDTFSLVLSPVTIGIILGLVVGKFIGIVGFSFFLVKSKIALLPESLSWKHICGVSMLAGMGFTMSLFISGLAFSDLQMILQAKLGIFIASITSALIGFSVLFLIKNNQDPAKTV